MVIGIGPSTSDHDVLDVRSTLPPRGTLGRLAARRARWAARAEPGHALTSFLAFLEETHAVMAGALVTVEGYLALLDREAGEHLEAAARDHLARAREGAGRLRDQLELATRYAELQALAHPPVPVDPGACLERVLDRLAPALERTGARVEASWLPEVEAEAPVLEAVLHDILLHLLRNRWDPAAPITVTAEQADGQVQIHLHGAHRCWSASGIALDGQPEPVSLELDPPEDLHLATWLLHRYGGQLTTGQDDKGLVVTVGLPLA